MQRTRIARGRTADVYAWQPGQVLKLFFDWCPHDWIDREITANRHLVHARLPVPQLLDVVEVDGRQGLIFERVDGPTMLHVSTTKPWLLVKMAQLLADLHTALHQIHARAFVSVHESLRAVIEQVEQLSSVQKVAILGYLTRLPTGDTLCHFDFHPDQVLLTPHEPVIIDWMTAQRGDPAADVARSSLMLSIGRPPHQHPIQRVFFRLAQGLFHRRYVQRYLALNPQVSLTDIRAWMLPVAAARLWERIEQEERHLLTFTVTALHTVEHAPDPGAAAAT